MTVHLSTLSSTGDRGTPTGSGAYYTSLATWETAAQGQHLAGDQTVLECYEGTTVTGSWQAGGELAENLTMSGWSNTSPTDNVVLRAAAGEEHGGNPLAGFRIKAASANYGTNITIENITDVTFDNFNCWNTRTSNGGCFYAGPAERTYLHNSIFRNDETPASISCIALSSATSDSVVRNCLIWRCSRGVSFSNFGVVTLENVTVVNCINVAFSGPSSSSTGLLFKNCVGISTGNTFDDRANGFSASCTNNASSDATAPGSNPQINIDSTAFVDYANDDYTPATGGPLDGTGADLSGTFTDDITGFTRVAPWEIGAYEIQAAAGVTFDGPDIVAQTGTESVLFSFDENAEGTVASRFTGATSYAYAPGSDQPAGLTVNATTGNLEGTPTAAGTFNVTIEGSD